MSDAGCKGTHHKRAKTRCNEQSQRQPYPWSWRFYWTRPEDFMLRYEFGEYITRVLLLFVHGGGYSIYKKPTSPSPPYV